MVLLLLRFIHIYFCITSFSIYKKSGINKRIDLANHTYTVYAHRTLPERTQVKMCVAHVVGTEIQITEMLAHRCKTWAHAHLVIIFLEQTFGQVHSPKFHFEKKKRKKLHARE